VIALARQKSAETGRTIGIYPENKHSTYRATVTDQKNHTRFGKHFFERKCVGLAALFCPPNFIQPEGKR